ncbi:MAG: DUF3137 domain-containing protein [Chitinophagales bacterium]
MKSPEEFDNYYKSTLVPILESLEPDRKKSEAAFWTAIISLSLFIPVILLFVAFENPWVLILLILPLIFSIRKFSDHSKIKASYVSKFKQTVIAGMIKAISDQLNYFPQSRIEINEYLEGDLFRARIDEFAGGDLIEGKLGATSIKFSELLHRERRESVDSRGNRRTYWVTIFKGIFFIADFNKNFSGRTFVLPESGFDFLGIGKLVEKWFEGRGEEVKLENRTFEKYFKVFGSDQIEARYILSTSMMERLVELREKVNRSIYVSFIDSKVFIALPINRDLFEPNELSSGVNETYLKEYFYYLNLITGIVDDLNLNTRIWTKQQ